MIRLIFPAYSEKKNQNFMHEMTDLMFVVTNYIYLLLNNYKDWGILFPVIKDLDIAACIKVGGDKY
jgi:uncharacterized membrane protein YjfL (UPF0719 family)